MSEDNTNQTDYSKLHDYFNNNKNYESQWISVKDRLPEKFKVVLTQHVDDLYPVAAYLYDDTVWMRETEGPEDIIIAGKHETLFRSPTHWMDNPEPPRGEQ